MNPEYLAERSSFACRALHRQMLRFFHISRSPDSSCPVPSASLVMVASPGSVLSELLLLCSSEPDLGDLEVRRVGKPYTFLKVHVSESSDFVYKKSVLSIFYF